MLNVLQLSERKLWRNNIVILETHDVILPDGVSVYYSCMCSVASGSERKVRRYQASRNGRKANSKSYYNIVLCHNKQVNDITIVFMKKIETWICS